MTEPPPTSRNTPSEIARWAARATDQQIDEAVAAGLSRPRIRDCARLRHDLHPDLMWLVDSGQMPVGAGLELYRLPDGRERTVLAAAIIHEREVSKAPVSIDRIRAVVRERLNRPEDSIKDVMDRVAGLRFHERPMIMHITEDLPSVYAAAWRWRDQSMEDYVARAPARLAQLTAMLESAAATTTLQTEDGASLSLRMTLSARPGSG